MRTLHVSAGGRGARMGPYLATISPMLPKHLLPIPAPGGSLLGNIVLRGHQSFDEVKVWTSKDTYPRIALGLERLATTNVVIDGGMTGPLGPMIRSLLATKERTYGSAGDFYCNFSWEKFEAFHESHRRPVSILVAKSVAAPQGARFLVKNGLISGWERVQRTTQDDFINLGCYIMDPDPVLMRRLRAMGKHKEDPFFDALIEKGMVAGYDPGVPGFNINVSEVYELLLQALAE